MKFTAVLAIVVGLVSAGEIEFCDSEPCQTGSCSTQSPGTGGLNCRQLGGIKSAFALAVDDGCSFTVYTDPNCSNGATTVPLNQCREFEPGLQSYSYDC